MDFDYFHVMENRVFFDHNATTPLLPEVKDRLVRDLDLNWGNASSIHWASRKPKEVLQHTRVSIARTLGVSPLEILFVSGATEGNQTVFHSLQHYYQQNPWRKKIITSAVEHPSVLEGIRRWVKSAGLKWVQVGVDRHGHWDWETFQRELDESVLLVSVMAANNETGVLLPIQEIARLAKSVGAWVHSDVTQAILKVPLSLDNLDYITFSGHKIHALKGVGVLWVKKGSPFQPLIVGGGQERFRRAGTENVLAISSLGAAWEILTQRQQEWLGHLGQLRHHFEMRIKTDLPQIQITHAEASRLPHTSHLLISGIEGESLVMRLDLEGYAVSSGSACSSGRVEPSPVLLAMGFSEEEARTGLRVSFGWSNTIVEVDRFVEALSSILSPKRMTTAQDHRLGNRRVSTSSRPRVLVAMSGGVDSSVSALLLKQQGFDVVGATMQVWDYSQCEVEDGIGTCCSSLDVEDARQVANRLGIPFFVVNCEKQFRQKVIQPFIESYLKGETPLPCAQCNTHLKFDYLIQKMEEWDCDYLATGHYAQKGEWEGFSVIQNSGDRWKDQTYFLFQLPQKVLPKLVFPVGMMEKTEVRRIALEQGLIVARKKDSTGICFVGHGRYSDFLETQISADKKKESKGLFRRYPSGEVLGEHQGYYRYTYGQSKGFGLSHHEKLYVIQIDADSQTVWLGEEKYLYRDSLKVRDVHWLVDPSKLRGKNLMVKIRSTHPGAWAKWEAKDDGLYLSFMEPQRAVTPGQAAAFYFEKFLVGGGWITK